MQRQLSQHWKSCGSKFLKEEVIYFCQVFIVYIEVISSIVNLCMSDSNTCLWSSLVSGSDGYLLPNPSISERKMTSFHPILPYNSSMNTFPDNKVNYYVTPYRIESNWTEIGKSHYRKQCLRTLVYCSTERVQIILKNYIFISVKRFYYRSGILRRSS